MLDKLYILLDILDRNVAKYCGIFENVAYAEKSFKYAIILYYLTDFFAP
jgi:hypothetical protein